MFQERTRMIFVLFLSLSMCINITYSDGATQDEKANALVLFHGIDAEQTATLMNLAGQIVKDELKAIGVRQGGVVNTTAMTTGGDLAVRDLIHVFGDNVVDNVNDALKTALVGCEGSIVFPLATEIILSTIQAFHNQEWSSEDIRKALNTGRFIDRRDGCEDPIAHVILMGEPILAPMSPASNDTLEYCGSLPMPCWTPVLALGLVLICVCAISTSYVLHNRHTSAASNYRSMSSGMFD